MFMYYMNLHDFGILKIVKIEYLLKYKELKHNNSNNNNVFSA